MRNLTTLFNGLLLAIAFTLVVGCQQENQEVTISNDVIISEPAGQAPPMDEGLLRHYATLSMQMMYQVDVLPHQIEKLNKNELTNWIAQNEVNKSAIINATNQHILSILLQQGHVDAVKVTSPFHPDFTESVYVIIPENFRVSEYVRNGATIITNRSSGDDNDDENICYAQSGYDVIVVHPDGSGDVSDCPPCLVECIDCSDPSAGVDNCLDCDI